jgi:predicted transcriptional regulator
MAEYLCLLALGKLFAILFGVLTVANLRCLLAELEIIYNGAIKMTQQDCPTDQMCAEYLKALGDPIRLGIIKALQTCPFTVSDLAEFLELDLQKVSHHLRILFHANLVRIQKDGKYRYYELNPQFVSKRQSTKALNLGCCTIGIHF